MGHPLLEDTVVAVPFLGITVVGKSIVALMSASIPISRYGFFIAHLVPD